MASTPLLASWSRDGDEYAAEPAAVVCLTEVLKLAVSATVYALTVAKERQTHRMLRWRDAARFAIPAGLFTVNNILLFEILYSLTATGFQLDYDRFVCVCALSSSRAFPTGDKAPSPCALPEDEQCEEEHCDPGSPSTAKRQKLNVGA